MTTKTQRNFQRQMRKVQREASKVQTAAFYSYIADDVIKTYYDEKKIRNSFNLFRIIRVAMFILIAATVLFGIIGYLASEKNLISIPMTTLFISMIFLFFGILHPKLVFFVKSRLEVIGLYALWHINNCFDVCGRILRLDHWPSYCNGTSIFSTNSAI
ncbi:hypothetical protein [Paenibacillus lignilyticus]|uniref:Uncharacterized protein n=1 Tax=Paenibacillus lignilyticus TaxID=1172615 RepID=A0ABS5CA43_9BACL|nr:hypothetical protein [Paenibacillus lignilyticus]MBP3962864.1 hypothetical protein [Paenibacillus lignilyticus]